MYLTTRFIANFLLLINLCGFITMGIDKYKSTKRLWRIPERMLFWFAIVGGSVGVYAGMMFFRHKTRHWYFVYGIPFIFAVQVLLVFSVVK